MGTNFYAIIPVKKRTTNKLRELADKLEDTSRKVNVENELYEIGEELKDHEIHLGKRSCGWAFLWDANNLKYYEPTLASIKKFIEDNNGKIVNEYGEKFTWDEFINDEIGNSLHPSETPIRNIDELKEQYNMPDFMINSINSDLFSKNLPYYHYCTSKTYYEMYPTESKYNYGCSDYDRRFEKYAKDGVIDSKYTDFVTNNDGGLRFSLFTDFS